MDRDIFRYWSDKDLLRELGCRVTENGLIDKNIEALLKELTRRASDGVGEWYYKNVFPIFKSVSDAMENDNVDKVYQNIVYSFIKNSVALFESLKKYLGSYPIAQEMRLLIEFESDLDFLINNPIRTSKVKKKIEKYHTDYTEGKRSWKDTIAKASKKIHLKEDDGKEIFTRDRVKRVFDEDIYDFYCAYAHSNMYAIWDDNERIAKWNAQKKSNRQKKWLLEYYPTILDRFIGTVKTITSDDGKIEYNPGKFKKEFDVLLDALSRAEVRYRYA